MFDYISHKICDLVFFLCYLLSWMFDLFATQVSDPMHGVVDREDGLAFLNDLVSYMIV